MITGFVRADRRFGLRNHVLFLPSVVCANRAVQEAKSHWPGSVAIEHPLGCAQIGIDKEQTWRTLVGIGSHPNVQHCVVLGLGCEGIAAQWVHEGIETMGRSSDVFLIQEEGGIKATGLKAASRPLFTEDDREAIAPHDVIIGIGELAGLGDFGLTLVKGLREVGFRLVQAVADDAATLVYAEPMPKGLDFATMVVKGGDAERLTGLVAAGAHMILSQGDAQHLGGHPIAPVVRIGYETTYRQAFRDDIDGYLADYSIEKWLAYLVDVMNGTMSASEKLQSELFAIERIGPTL